MEERVAIPFLTQLAKTVVVAPLKNHSGLKTDDLMVHLVTNGFCLLVSLCEEDLIIERNLSLKDH